MLGTIEKTTNNVATKGESNTTVKLTRWLRDLRPGQHATIDSQVTNSNIHTAIANLNSVFEDRRYTKRGRTVYCVAPDDVVVRS